MFEKIRLQFINLSLKKKMLLITLMNTTLLSAAALIGMQVNTTASNKALYRALANSLSYSASEISNHLTSIETMSSMILSNNSVQDNLSVIKDSSDSLLRTDAYKNLYSIIPAYHQIFKSDYISYLDLHNDSFTTSSNSIRSAETPGEICEDVIHLADQEDGAPSWVTKYSDEHGIFMGRSIRRIGQLKLDTLGTLVVNIDINKMVQSCTRFNNQYGSTSYLLFNEDKLVYRSSDLTIDDASHIRQNLPSNYGVFNLNQHNYFSVIGSIPDFGWTYILLVPYDNITESLQLSRNTSILVIIISIFLAIIASNYLLESVIFHFHVLMDKMKTFGKDETIQVPSLYDYDNRKDEIGILHTQFDYMAHKIQNLIQTNYINEILKKEAQIKALETQINPHFLYNTLESINWRAKAIHESSISSMVESLGYLLRSTLSGQDASHTLGEELMLTGHYINIQKFRFEDRLLYETSIAPDIPLDLPFPRLIIQPLVENAVSYGPERSTDSCHIKVSISVEGCNLIIQVKNSGSQFEEDLLSKLEKGTITPRGFGIGLLNIDKRLHLSHGPDFGLKLYNEGGMAVAQIILPYTSHKTP